MSIQELVSSYNDRYECYKIPIELSDTELIFSLWVRGIDIPSKLTFGEAYDTEFKLEIFDSGKYYNEYCIDKNSIVILYKYSNYLSDFLFLTLGLKPNDLTEISDKNIKEDIEDQLKRFNGFWTKLSISNGKPITSYEDFRIYLVNNKLSKLDLVYIAICCQTYNVFPNGFRTYISLNDFYQYIAYKNHSFKISK